MNTNKLKKFAIKSRDLLILEISSNINKLKINDIDKLPTTTLED
jgi:hypothetical protein